MPPSLVLVASAWESPSPGAWGSLNGSWAAGAVGVAGGLAVDDDDPLPPPGSSNWGALRGVGRLRADEDRGLVAVAAAVDHEQRRVLLGRPAARDQRDREVTARRQAGRRGDAVRAGHGGRGADRPERADQRAVVGRADRLVLAGRPPGPREHGDQPGGAGEHQRLARRPAARSSPTPCSPPSGPGGRRRTPRRPPGARARTGAGPTRAARGRPGRGPPRRCGPRCATTRRPASGTAGWR